MQDELKQWLANYLKRKGWSLRELAERADTTHSSLSRINTDREQVGIRILNKLAAATGTPIVNLLEMAELIPKSPEDTRDTRLLKQIYYDLDENGRKELIKYATYLQDRSTNIT